MKSTDPILDAVRKVAREAEPEPLDDFEVSAMVQVAIAAAAAEASKADGAADVSSKRGSRATLYAMAAIAATVGLAIAAGLSMQGSPSQAPLSMTLPSGDHLVATAGATFELENADEIERTIALEHGTMLFDVTPLAVGESFEVRTPHANVRVRGTVFSVEVDGEDTVVRVYEGQVEVARGERSTRLVAGAMLRSRQDAPTALMPGALGDEGVQAAALRAVAWRDEPTADDAHAREALAAADLAESGPASETADVLELAGRAESTGPPLREIPGPSRATPPRERAPRAAPAPPTAAEARRWLVDGEAERALSAAQAGATTTEWRWLEADALRALGRAEEAAGAYDALHRGAGPGWDRAGLAAARLRFHRLADPEAALLSLDGTTHRGSPFAERGLALRARALMRLERRSQAEGVAHEYLERYPDGGMADWMRDLLGAN